MGEAEQDSCSHGSSMGQQRPTCPKAEGLPGKERECGSQHPYTPAVGRLHSGVAFPGLQSGLVSRYPCLDFHGTTKMIHADGKVEETQWAGV